MKIADTSALYALWVENDAHHEQAKRDAQVMHRLLVPAEVFSEFLTILRMRIGPANALRAATELRTQPGIEIQPSWDNPWDDVLGAAWKEFSAGDNPSYVDAIVIAWCKKRKLQPWTYDAQIAKACST